MYSKQNFSLKISGIIMALALLSWGIWLFSYIKQPIKLMYSNNDIQINEPISVAFNRPVQRNISYSIDPIVDGKWRVKSNIIGIERIEFTPKNQFIAGSKIKLAIKNIKPFIASSIQGQSRTIDFSIEQPSDIVSITPVANAVNIPVSTGITVRLASPNRNLRELKIETDAPLQNEKPSTSDDIVFKWLFKTPLSQGKTYHYSISDLKQIGDKAVLTSSSFTTVSEPKVSGTNKDHFYPGEMVTIKFDQDMKTTDSIFKFEFAGSGHWSDSKTYIYTPSGLSPGRTYQYYVANGSVSSTGGITEHESRFNIATPGPTVITAFSPKGSNVETSSSISFTFDQPVDHGSAESSFSTAPASSGNFTWNGNSMLYKPNGLNFQTNYTATLVLGVKSVYGLASMQSFSSRFTTTYQTMKLIVPYFHQSYRQSCEATALKMALAYRGISASEMDIVRTLGYAPRARDRANNLWDNPNQMFVGDINGWQNSTGYGVYSGPVADAARSYGRSAAAQSGVSANYIAEQVIAGNPVIVWGSSSKPKLDSWNTSSGPVQAWVNEHTRVVVGVAGKSDAPIGFYLHDPLNGGSNMYWTASQLMINMNVFGSLSNQTVVVN